MALHGLFEVQTTSTEKTMSVLWVLSLGAVATAAYLLGWRDAELVTRTIKRLTDPLAKAIDRRIADIEKTNSLSELAQKYAVLEEKHELLVSAVNAMDDTCTDECDSYGHSNTCEVDSVAAARFIEKQRIINALLEERAEADKEIAKWHAANIERYHLQTTCVCDHCTRHRAAIVGERVPTLDAEQALVLWKEHYANLMEMAEAMAIKITTLAEERADAFNAVTKIVNNWRDGEWDTGHVSIAVQELQTELAPLGQPCWDVTVWYVARSYGTEPRSREYFLTAPTEEEACEQAIAQVTASGIASEIESASAVLFKASV